MFSIYLGFTPAVVVRGLKDLKEVLVNKGVDFSDRPQNRLTDLVAGGRGKNGISKSPSLYVQ